MREELNYEPFWVEVAEALRSTLLNTNILQGIHVQLMNQQPPQQPPQPPLYTLAQIFQQHEPVGRTKEASYPFDQQMIMQKVIAKNGTSYYYIRGTL
jgi:hypothetical protein